MVRAMNDGDGGRGNRVGGSSTPGSRHNDPDAAPPVGRTTLVEQALTGVPLAPADHDEDVRRVSGGAPPVQRKIGGEGEASAPPLRTVAAPISMLDLFGSRPQPASTDAPPIQRKSIDGADGATRRGADGTIRLFSATSYFGARTAATRVGCVRAASMTHSQPSETLRELEGTPGPMTLAWRRRHSNGLAIANAAQGGAPQGARPRPRSSTARATRRRGVRGRCDRWRADHEVRTHQQSIAPLTTHDR